MCDAIADEAELLASGRPEEFQNRVHLAMRAKGFDAAPSTPAD
jgi:PTH1 family peptidyl-tRNA hydrolase